jgi:2-amino-4-ketopentanoate thiolase alpha subunit
MSKECVVMVRKGEWVQIHQIVLEAEERTARIPEDTKEWPFELWVKGFIEADAEIGDIVDIKTLTGRMVRGELVEVNPGYHFGFGEEFVPEVLKIGQELRRILREGEN